MTSILTNGAAISALQTLRSMSSNLESTQRMVSSSLRVGAASDNAAYWSISTTMRSDRMAISAVSDALGLGAAKVDTAYAGMSAVIDLLAEFKARLVAAKEDGVDKAKIQTELEQLKQQAVSIATSASFSGQNWLNTDIDDIMDADTNGATVLSSFVRNDGGSVAVNTTTFHLSQTSLFNTHGGGILQSDPRDLKSIGGLRGMYWDDDGFLQYADFHFTVGGRASFDFYFSGPVVFDDPSDEITFDVTVDADNPAHGLPGPQSPGKTTSVTIDRSLVDSINPSWNGVISDYQQYISVMNRALQLSGSDARLGTVTINGKLIPDLIDFYSSQNRANGLDGSYVEVSGFNNTTNTGGGLTNRSDWGERGNVMTLHLEQFENYIDGNSVDGVSVSFDFSINYSPAKSYSFDRTYVNTLLGKENGKIETPAELATLYQSLLSSDWPELVISAGSNTVTLSTDVGSDRRAGSDSIIYFSNIRVSNEPIPRLNFLDIDIEAHPNAVTSYIRYIETASARAVDGAAALGALSKRIEMQTEFAARMTAAVDRGVGRLVDADMNEASARLKAIQTQQQLALQSLSIANQNAENVTQLFR